MIFKVRIRGTIDDEVEVEAESIEEAKELAINDWTYVEFHDLWVEDDD